MSNIPIIPARLDWPSAIGNFLINFGTLHRTVLIFLKNNLEPVEFAQFRERPLKEQVERIARHVRGTGYPRETKEAITTVLARIDPIRELRNHIAHGHLTVRLDVESKWVISISLPKDLDLEYSAETRHVTFDELRTNLTKLAELIEGFERLAGFKPGWGTWTEGPATGTSADEEKS